MRLTFHHHPLASFCHKVLIALYEKEIAFVPVIVDLGDPDAVAEYRKLSPLAKIPVLVDEDSGRVVGETSVMLEFLENIFSNRPLIPRDPDAALDARYWDRFYDFSVHVQMQKIVTDNLRPEGSRDAYGVEEARGQLRAAYAVIDRAMAGRRWAAGGDFTIGDCSAEPALFYANTVEPIGNEFPNAASYLERLMLRPSSARVLREAEPYFVNFPMQVKPDISMLDRPGNTA